MHKVVEQVAKESQPSPRALVVVLLIAACWFARNDVDPDLWGHIRYGDDLLSSGSLPSSDSYSYTAGDHPWINHEIGSEIFLALLFRFGGGAAIVAFKTLLGIAILMTLLRDWRKSRPLLAWMLPLTCALVMALGWAPRPQIFGYFFFALLLRIFQRAEARPIQLAWTLPLLAVWTNFHGSFLYGLAMLGIFIASNIAGLVGDPAQVGLKEKITSSSLGVLALLATLINPYGTRIYSGLLHELSIQRSQVTEWGPLPWTRLEFPSMNALLLLTVAIMILARRHLRTYQHLLLAVALIQAQLHLRHSVFVALLALAWLQAPLEIYLDSRSNRISRPESEALHSSGSKRRSLDNACLSLIGLFGATLMLSRWTEMRVHPTQYPVYAFQFLADKKLQGRIVVPFNWAQYMIFAFYPAIKVSFDGRYGTVYSPEVLDMNFDLWYPENSGQRSRSSALPFAPARVLEYGSPDLVLIDRRYSQAEQVLRSRTDFQLLYEDPLALVFSKRSQFPRVHSAAELRGPTTPSADNNPRWEKFPALPRR